MSSLDARMHSLLATRAHYAELARARSASPIAAPVIPDRVGVLVKFTGDRDDLERAGLQIQCIVGDESSPFRIASGSIALDDAGRLAEVSHVTRIEADRPVRPDLDVSTVEIKAKPLRTGPSPLTGQGVIVGVIDSGFDYRHHAFRFPNAGSRVLFLWDQSLTVRPRRPGDPFQEAAPPEFTTGPNPGVEYSQAQINMALAASNPLDVVRTTDDTAGHGTHVTGTAAGDGTQAGTKEDDTCTGSGTYVGVAPAAGIIFVRNFVEGVSSSEGRSQNLVNAVRYIFLRAQQLNMACVINASQGDNLGAHDGTSLVEQAIDLELTGHPGRAVVLSAGNEAESFHHAMSDPPIPIGGVLNVTFDVPAGDTSNRFIECWYNGTTTLDVALTSPGVPPNVSALVHAGDAPLPFVTNPLALPANQVRATITSTNLSTDNLDKQITLDFIPPAGVAIPNGTYTLQFTNVGTAPATLHCWIDRGSKEFRFTSNFKRSHTVGIPGTCVSAITVASYSAEHFVSSTGVVTEPGDLADSSARGPTRTGGQKPDIAAPGVAITAARANSTAGCCCDCCYTFYVDKNGTSMAAPHIAGVVALMFQKNRTLDAQAIKTALTSTARNPGGGVVLPDFGFGAGKVDATEAVKAVPPGPGGGGAPLVPVPRIVPPADAVERSLMRRLQRFNTFVLQYPAGHLWSALVSHHVDEVLRLIATNRRVATVWHRNGGPAMVRAALSLTADPPEIAIPRAVGPVPLAEQLDRIFDSWRRYGSPRLVDDIDRYRAEVRRFPGRTVRAILTDGSLAA